VGPEFWKCESLVRGPSWGLRAKLPTNLGHGDAAAKMYGCVWHGLTTLSRGTGWVLSQMTAGVNTRQVLHGRCCGRTCNSPLPCWVVCKCYSFGKGGCDMSRNRPITSAPVKWNGSVKSLRVTARPTDWLTDWPVFDIVTLLVAPSGESDVKRYFWVDSVSRWSSLCHVTSYWPLADDWRWQRSRSVDRTRIVTVLGIVGAPDDSSPPDNSSSPDTQPPSATIDIILQCQLKKPGIADTTASLLRELVCHMVSHSRGDISAFTPTN